VKLRTRIAALTVMVGLAAGIGASTQAMASAPAPQPAATLTTTNGCIVLPLLQTAVCIPRF